jgi:hypothetical protein
MPDDTKAPSRLHLGQCRPASLKDRFALADSIGVPIDVAADRDHRLEADAIASGVAQK